MMARVGLNGSSHLEKVFGFPTFVYYPPAGADDFSESPVFIWRFIRGAAFNTGAFRSVIFGNGLLIGQETCIDQNEPVFPFGNSLGED
jgi:hypothetical protein